MQRIVIFLLDVTQHSNARFAHLDAQILRRVLRKLNVDPEAKGSSAGWLSRNKKMFSSANQPVARAWHVPPYRAAIFHRTDEVDGIRGLCMNILWNAHEGNMRAAF